MKKRQKVLLATTMYPDRTAWEKIGFSFKVIPGDFVLCEATLPEGWSLEATDHSMYFDLFDEYGNRRGQLFYNSISKERNSTMSLFRKYGVHEEYDKDTDSIGYYFGNDEERLFETKYIKLARNVSEEERKAFLKERVELKNVTLRFAKENYPDCMDVNAYWEKGKKLSKKNSN